MKILIVFFLTISSLLSNVGEIAVVKGDATINRITIDRNIDYIKAYSHMKLLQKDTVNTFDGRLQMHFLDDTVISLGKESKFIIQEYLYSGDMDTPASSFLLEKGFAKVITGAISKIMPNLFSFQTATTTITPHGTAWSMDVTKDREHYRVLSGSISLHFNDNKSKDITIQAGESVTISTHNDKRVTTIKKEKKTITRTKRINFSDQEELSNADVANDVQSMKESESRASTENIVEEEVVVSEPEEEVVVSEPEEEVVVSEPEEEVVVSEPEEEVVVENGDDQSNDDGNNGHGNDPDGVDDSNPGNSGNDDEEEDDDDDGVTVEAEVQIT